jgi:hypothetical protein
MSELISFHYDGQIRKFVIQFIRMFSNFQVQFGDNALGNRTLQTVPIYYGDPSRQASVILKNNSENMLNAVPAMAAYIAALSYDRERLQNPYHESTMRVRDQAYNSQTQDYTGTQDNVYTVERLMPAPYKLTIKLDVWTSNMDQKHQLIEQIAPLFNPSFEIQSNDNYIDWTSLSVVHLTDSVFTSRTMPSTSDDNPMDIATFTFEIPIWISLPAKVKKGGVVAQIIANIHDENGSWNENLVNTVATSQMRYTPMNCSIVYSSNTVTLYKAIAADGTGVTAQWDSLVSLYGSLTNGISQVRLTFAYPDGPHEIVGTVAYSPTNATQLIFSPDAATLPANTLDSVTAIIDPFTVNITEYSVLTPAANTRYLILNPIGDVNTPNAVAWQGAQGTNLLANANDIIQWNGTYWIVALDSQHSPHGIQYVTNQTTMIQYFWDGMHWQKSVDGVYSSGEWSIVL